MLNNLLPILNIASGVIDTFKSVLLAQLAAKAETLIDKSVMITRINQEPITGKLLEIRVVDGENTPSFLVEIEADNCCEDISLNICIDIREFEMLKTSKNVVISDEYPRTPSHPLEGQRVSVITDFCNITGTLVHVSFTGNIEIDVEGQIHYINGNYAMTKAS